MPLTFVVRAWARRQGMVAKPRADRWHRKPTALFGGVAIVAAFLVSYLLRRPLAWSPDALVVVCAFSMFLLGLLDDFVALKPYTKLVGQIVISAALTTGGMRLHFLSIEVLDQAFSIFWLVAITNALNLLDNLDGLAGGVTVIAASFLAYFCHVAGQHQAAQLAAAVSGAALGFVFFNFHPASIFMGDCGSLFLGFFLGSMGMLTSAPGIRRNVAAMLAVPVFVLLIPILDTALVTLNRSVHGRPVSQGGRDHTSHRLVALGFSERAAALWLWSGAVATGLVAVVLQRLALPMTVFVIVCSMVLVTFVGLWVSRVKVYTPMPVGEAGAGKTLIPTLADFAYKRRLFEVLSDLTVIVMAYYGAFLIRFDGNLVEPHYSWFHKSLPLIIVVQMLVLLMVGLYKGLWRYTTVDDLGPVTKRLGLAWLAAVVALTLTFREEGMSRGVLVIDGLLLLVGICGSRLAVRLISRGVLPLRDCRAGTKVLIYGANDMGEAMLRLIQSDPDLGLLPVGFLDDDLAKKNRYIHGLKVLGPAECLTDPKLRLGAEEVAVAPEHMASGRYETLCVLFARYHLRQRKLTFAVQPVTAPASSVSCVSEA